MIAYPTPDWLSVLELSVRAERCIRMEGIESFAALAAYSERDLMRIPDCGKLTAREIREAVARLTQPEPPPPPSTAERTASALERIAVALEALVAAATP